MSGIEFHHLRRAEGLNVTPLEPGSYHLVPGEQDICRGKAAFEPLSAQARNWTPHFFLQLDTALLPSTGVAQKVVEGEPSLPTRLVSDLRLLLFLTATQGRGAFHWSHRQGEVWMASICHTALGPQVEQGGDPLPESPIRAPRGPPSRPEVEYLPPPGTRCAGPGGPGLLRCALSPAYCAP